jgi:hypothetical protein
MPPSPWNDPAHYYYQTLSSSVTATAFPIVHCRHQKPPAATAVKRHLCRCRPLPSCLHLSLLPPSPSSIAAFKHRCPPLPPAATDIKCHLCHRRPSLLSIAASIKCLQMPPPHFNLSAHRRRWWLQWWLRVLAGGSV